MGNADSALGYVFSESRDRQVTLFPSNFVTEVSIWIKWDEIG